MQIWCPGGCSHAYCSARCCAEAWQTRHCLLCTGAHSDERVAHVQGMQPCCPYTALCDMSPLSKWPHDRRVFGWLLGALASPANGDANPEEALPSSPSAMDASSTEAHTGCDGHPDATNSAALPVVSSLAHAAHPDSQHTAHAQRGAKLSDLQISMLPATDADCSAQTEPFCAQVGRAASSSSAFCTTLTEAAGSQKVTAQEVLQAICGVGVQGGVPGARTQAPAAVHTAQNVRAVRGRLPMPPWAVGVDVDQERMSQFEAYTRSAELDAMRVAAQIVALAMCTALQCAALLLGTVSPRSCDLGTALQRVALSRCRTILGSHDAVGHDEATVTAAAFRAAWQPLQMAMKAPWLECLVVPEDMDSDAYKQQLKILIKNCTTLLSSSCHDDRFDALFQEVTLSNLMGALELSSLGVTVESPVEDFYDELEARRPRADTPTALADQLKGILGTTDIACDGVAFYPLQSCLNHANRPNCSCQKDIEEKDGAAVIVTKTGVKQGEELTISYIGSTRKMSDQEVETALAEYGIPMSTDGTCQAG